MPEAPPNGTQPLRIGVVGLGWVGQARHVPTLRSSPKFTLVGVADRAAERVDAFRNANTSLRASVSKNIAGIDWINEVDAISIATAPMAHHALVCEALSLGKHVITEKPFAMNVGQGEQMVEAAQRADKRLAVVHNFQFARSMAKLDHDLASGRIGTIKGVRALQLGNPSRRLPSWYQELPFGLFYDESPHLLYLLDRLVGPLELTKSVVIPSGDGSATPFQIDAWFLSDRHVPVTLSCCFEASVSEWYLVVQGENAMAIVDIFRDIYIRLPNDRTHATADVIRTSATATAHHWIQHGSSGLLHILGKLRYGNDIVFKRFAEGVAGNAEAMGPIEADRALHILRLQHEIIDRHERVER